jgi:short-subunit dehydrogenase
MLLCQEFVPLLIAAKGKIVNIGSVVGILPCVVSLNFPVDLSMVKILSAAFSLALVPSTACLSEVCSKCAIPVRG